MKKWYRSAQMKGILLVVQHILAVLAGISLTWLVVYLGVTQDMLSEKNVKNYEDTETFGAEVRSDSQNVLSMLLEMKELETNGQIDENKIVDIKDLAENSKITGENKNGLAYRLGDLNEWGIKRDQGEAYASYDRGDNSIIVCEKQNGGYQYFYYDEFRESIENGELFFVEDSDSGVSKDDVMEWLREGSYYRGATGWSSEALVDQDDQILYRTFWNYDGYWIDEAYTPVGADNLLDIVNHDPAWNGKLEEAFMSIDASISMIRSDIINYKQMKNTWLEGDTNLAYLYADTESETVYTNREEYRDYSKLEENLEKLTSDGRYVLVRSKLADFKSNISGANAEEWKHAISQICGKEDGFVYAANVDTSFPIQDRYYSQNQLYEQYSPWTRGMFIMGIVSVIGIIIIFVWLTAVAGRRPGDQEVHLNILDRMKTEFIVVPGAGILLFALWMLSDFYFYSTRVYGESAYSTAPHISALDILLVSSLALLSCMIFTTAYLSIVRRVKAKTLWKNSMLKWLGGMLAKAMRHMGEIWRTVLALAVLAVINVLGVASGAAPVILLMIVADLIGAVYMVYQAVGRHRIGRGVERIAKGEVDYKIPLTGLRGGQREVAEKINTIGEGLDAAVEASMKNERLKTDLITNVSHDIKTPLTSIINYVDLLKRENLKDPKIQGYLDILEVKAQRLKTLTEDVVEASKVSSGNISLEYMDIDLAEMIQQTSGEFAEKFSNRNLTEVLSIPSEPVIIRVDGRRMWRVLENIYNNAAKYALEGTRIYADLSARERTVIFSLKNVSEQPLNIRAEELTERFIRGDVSRSTEGSGLGLSIAKSLVTMQGGTFELYLDGDLFKVTITFPQVKK